MTLTFTRHRDDKRDELRPRGAAPVHVRRGAPNGRPLPEGWKPRFTLADDPAGASPLAVVVQQGGGHLAVLTPNHEHLAELHLPPREKRWRPSYEIHLPDGTVLRGREGTMPSQLLCLVQLPFVLLYLVALAFSDSPAGTFTAPLRTAWKRPGALFGRATLTESARGRFRVRGDRLDHRVAYAQAVAKYWER
ncbi:hypothetical protein ACFVJW_27200 [Streptomyces libani]|uniref:Uncharacterized protein n=1 Tax=Streptomyces nigrescens TaxID=1920 RepID=A0A640TCS9_STRNI|nr:MULTISPECIES: hypothetical protein [Streptomyces]MCX5447924.1 hypothetical protein [Streptomyces libani]WAT95856.1 hypothetical protein STRLI_001621 [Streptomyces libani subsp. libani]WDT58420.1 hypothetical protein NUT86_32675 [Streptomyces sp. G7(2002)]GFE21148.1 hypothetical protein Sliba_16010 [Streptomyces libani subsp. libani]GGW03031.1 hypothetical protein GCM10010500_62020 [Streptomyces libani subsp. libani]